MYCVSPVNYPHVYGIYIAQFGALITILFVQGVLFLHLSCCFIFQTKDTDNIESTNMNSQDKHLLKLLDTLQKRYNALEIQAAQQGFHTDPSIHLELENLKEEIEEISIKIKSGSSASEGTAVSGEVYAHQIEELTRKVNALMRNAPVFRGNRKRNGQFELFRTNVSQAFWYLPARADEDKPFVAAKRAREDGRSTTFAWFDELLRNGLYLPTEEKRPLMMVIAGPPGSGKTTLALEMCYRLAKDEDPKNPAQLYSLYISLDQDTDRLITNSERLGYENARQYIISYDAEHDPSLSRRGGNVAVYGRDAIMEQSDRSRLHTDGRGSLQKIIDGAKADLAKRLNSASGIEFTPDIVVVDSLNIVPGANKVDLFQDFQNITSSAGKLAVFIIDSMSGNERYAMWEYTSDFVIRLDSTYLNNYYVRTIEIVKARYQSHVWGKHQFKVYEMPNLPPASDPNVDGKRRRNHPYRQEGGVFIYPSIHYYLSLYKKQSPSTKVTYAPTKPFLKRVLEEGLPEGRCTAFIGTRGGHKSHFGYLHLLNRIIDNEEQQESALIISLRDDEEMTAKTIDNIIKTEFDHRTSLKRLERENRLEVLYFHPGYITPEEFFHRVYISVKRLQRDCKKLTVLFNSVDQLSSRFPLCAKENIFIPGIIEFLTGEGATSIFIAVDEQGQPAEQYGLLPMADLILSFYPYRFKYDDYYELIDKEYSISTKGEHFLKVAGRMKELYGEDGKVEPIVLQVVRFAGGEQAGAKGILELVKASDLGLYEKAGLHFTPLSPKIQLEPVLLLTQHSK